jgi:hypothetical protein
MSYPASSLPSSDDQKWLVPFGQPAPASPANGAGSAAAAVSSPVFHAMQTEGTPSRVGSAKLQQLAIDAKIRAGVAIKLKYKDGKEEDLKFPYMSFLENEKEAEVLYLSAVRQLITNMEDCPHGDYATYFYHLCLELDHEVKAINEGGPYIDKKKPAINQQAVWNYWMYGLRYVKPINKAALVFIVDKVIKQLDPKVLLRETNLDYFK